MSKDVQKKIKTLRSLTRTADLLRKKGKKIVLCHGVFDLIHPGHLAHFTSAKSHGDVLIVTITADSYVKKGPGRPYFSQDLRAHALASLEQVDFVAIISADSAVPAIEKILPHVYAKGPDYVGRKPSKGKKKLDEEAQAIKDIKGQIIFTQDEVVFSSSSLINTFLDSYSSHTKEYLASFRQKYSSDAIVSKLEVLKDMRALVLGDTIIDQYVYCEPLGKSSKEPIIVNKYVKEETYLGGVLATANHAASLLDHIHLVTSLGKTQTFSRYIRSRLAPQIKSTFFYESGKKTIIKRRFLDSFSKQKQFQITYVDDTKPVLRSSEQVYQYVSDHLKEFDLVIINDFGHGTISPDLINLVCKKALYLALNVQTNSANFGFNVVTKYPRADFVCIDEQEIRLALHDKFSPIEKLVIQMVRRMKCDRIIVTKGPKGTISYSKEYGYLISPALTDRVVDRVGAGDALFAISAPCMCAGFSDEVVSFIGNVAGALQVQIVGNKTPIQYTDIVRFMTRLLK